MREQDRRRACEVLQEIETDLVFGFIEAHQDGRIDDAARLLLTLERLANLMGKLCRKR